MPLKIVHTSDWHLGKKLYKACRLKEQANFLEWLNEHLRKINADALLIAGDIFDTPHPSSNALKLYFDFLKDVPCPVYLIAGNHDSGRFLEAPKTFLEEKNIHIVGELPQESSEISNVNFTISNGVEKVNLTMLPYFRTYEILNLANSLLSTKEKDQLTTEDAILLTLERFMNESKKDQDNAFNILMAHHLFGSFEMAGSEQGLTLSGIESLPTELLKEKYNYVALGHIHKKQVLRKSEPYVIYSGSPLPFRFSEKSKKKILELDITDSCSCKISEVAVPIFKPLFQIDCNLSELEFELEQLQEKLEGVDESYLEIKVTLDIPQTGLIDEIKAKIPNNCELISFFSSLSRVSKKKNEKKSINFEDTVSLFKTYYEKKFPESNSIPRELEIDFLNLLNESRETLRDK